MIVVHDVGTSEVGELAGLVVVGREVVFNLNIASPRRHIQPVADMLNLRKKHLPKMDEVLLCTRKVATPGRTKSVTPSNAR